MDSARRNQWHLAQVADLEGVNRSKSLHAEYVGAGLKTPKLVICSRIAASLCIIDLIVSDWSPTKQPEMLLKRSISSRILLSHSLAPTRSSVDLVCYHVDDGWPRPPRPRPLRKADTPR